MAFSKGKDTAIPRRGQSQDVGIFAGGESVVCRKSLEMNGKAHPVGGGSNLIGNVPVQVVVIHDPVKALLAGLELLAGANEGQGRREGRLFSCLCQYLEQRQVFVRKHQCGRGVLYWRVFCKQILPEIFLTLIKEV